jgi:hypothetical protein
MQHKSVAISNRDSDVNGIMKGRKASATSISRWLFAGG